MVLWCPLWQLYMGGRKDSFKCHCLSYWFSPFLQVYHDIKERESMEERDGDNSRPKPNELAYLSQARFLVNVHESLGLDYEKILDSSMAIIEAMLQESNYINNERNKALKKGGDGEDFEWVELPSFDDPTKTIRYKKYYDIAGQIKV